MNWLTFLSIIIPALARLAFGIFALCLLRKPICTSIGRLKECSGYGIKAKFGPTNKTPSKKTQKQVQVKKKD
jgi:hypothetical protein